MIWTISNFAVKTHMRRLSVRNTRAHIDERSTTIGLRASHTRQIAFPLRALELQPTFVVVQFRCLTHSTNSAFLHKIDVSFFRVFFWVFGFSFHLKFEDFVSFRLFLCSVAETFASEKETIVTLDFNVKSTCAECCVCVFFKILFCYFLWRFFLFLQIFVCSAACTLAFRQNVNWIPFLDGWMILCLWDSKHTFNAPLFRQACACVYVWISALNVRAGNKSSDFIASIFSLFHFTFSLIDVRSSIVSFSFRRHINNYVKGNSLQNIFSTSSFISIRVWLVFSSFVFAER